MVSLLAKTVDLVLVRLSHLAVCFDLLLSFLYLALLSLDLALYLDLVRVDLSNCLLVVVQFDLKPLQGSNRVKIILTELITCFFHLELSLYDHVKILLDL